MREVSIITPCYNASKTIYKTLDSIRKQSFHNFEVLIIDDFSTDNSLQIINLFTSKDKRFKLYERKKNYGVVSSRNFGLKYATGRYIAFLDSDDVWKNEFLKLSLKIHKKYNPGITHSPYYRFYSANQKFFGQKYNPPLIVNSNNILKRNYMGMSTVVVDKKIIGKFRFPNLRPEDYNLWLILMNNKKVYSRSIDSLQVYIRLHNERRSKNKLKALMRLRKFYFRNENLNFFMKIFYLCCYIIENSKIRISKKINLEKNFHKDIF